MRSLRWFRIPIPKTRRILYIFSLFVGLYLLFILVPKVKNFTVKSPINGLSLLKHIRLTSTKLTSNASVNNIILQKYTGGFESEPPRNWSINGALNVHTWAFTCELSLQKILQNPLFPIFPNAQTFVGNLEMKWIEENSKNVKTFGRRIFGFIFAPFTGSYRFSMSVSSDAELWLSRDLNWENVQLLCRRNSSEFYSSEIHLKEHHFYFMEILLTQTPQNYFHLMWKMPHSEDFEEISKKYLYSFMGKSLEFKEFIKDVPLTLATQNYINSHPKHSILSSTEKFLSGVKYVEWSDVKLALPLCRYQPGYVGKRVLHQYHAVEEFVNPSYVYPEVKHDKVKDGKWNPWFPLSEKEALDIVEKYLKYLGDAYPGKYKLKQILNVEKKPDWHKGNQVFYKGTSKNGDRFFLELLLCDNTNYEDIILSEYVYQYEKTKKLCYPEGMQWNKTAPVCLLISARKQAAWVWHFIKNVERIYQSTADENLHVIVYDYNSTNIDIEAEFQRSSFKNYKVLKNPDSKYSRTYSLNRAAEAMTDPNTIVFTLDLHLEIPPLFPYNVRKHCIKGKMVYTPIITRLTCGASPRYLSGSWDPWGYGMFGAYKTDWDNFKGFDEVKFKTKWGGEDWDLVNRAYIVGLEFERIKHADFYHYDHSRVGMWT